MLKKEGKSAFVDLIWLKQTIQTIETTKCRNQCHVSISDSLFSRRSEGIAHSLNKLRGQMSFNDIQLKYHSLTHFISSFLLNHYQQFINITGRTHYWGNHVWLYLPNRFLRSKMRISRYSAEKTLVYTQMYDFLGFLFIIHFRTRCRSKQFRRSELVLLL